MQLEKHSSGTIAAPVSEGTEAARGGTSALDTFFVAENPRWLPRRGEGVIVGETHIVAFDCYGPPFYRLSRVR